ncbi:MAG: phosphopantetheine-binding protein, partial [Nostoc sp.]
MLAYIVLNVEMPRQSLQRGATALDGFPGLKQVAWEPPQRAASNLASLLRKFLKEKLPEYMVPKAFVMLDSLPLTASGKVDRWALTELDSPASPSIDKAFIAPRTPTELTLAKIWVEVLNVERVGIQDNFFDLGGDSLLTVRLLKQINKQFECEFPLSSLFLNPTI